MKREEKEKKVSALWEEYVQLVRQRQEKEKEVKRLKEEEEAVKGLIVSLVPEGGELGGVVHSVNEKVSISYGKAYEALIERCVPKTRRKEAEEVKEEFTSRRVYHSVKGLRQ